MPLRKPARGLQLRCERRRGVAASVCCREATFDPRIRSSQLFGSTCRTRPHRCRTFSTTTDGPSRERSRRRDSPFTTRGPFAVLNWLAVASRRSLAPSNLVTLSIFGELNGPIAGGTHGNLPRAGGVVWNFVAGMARQLCWLWNEALRTVRLPTLFSFKGQVTVRWSMCAQLPRLKSCPQVLGTRSRSSLLRAPHLWLSL